MGRRTAMRAGIAVGTVLIVVAALGPSLLRTPSPTPGPSGPVAIATPGATPAGTPGPLPSATPDPWSDLEVEPYEPLAQLVALDPDRLGFAEDSTFRLHTLDGRPAAALAAGLEADPPITLAIEPGDSPDVAIVRIAAAPAAGTRYRFRLAAEDGSLVGSWVFRARAPLQVVTTLPGDRATSVPPNTGIEVTFDQDGTTGLPERFSIDPAVPGRFEQHGRTWAFVPDAPLQPASIYTVTVRAGVAVDGSAETLEEDVTFRFETGVPGQAEPDFAFGRQVVEVRPNVEPDIAIWFDEDDDDRPRIPESVVVVVHRLPTFGAVVAAAEKLLGPDGWALASAAAVVDTAGLTRVARLDSRLLEMANGWVVHVPARLDAGFYVLTIDQDGPPVQAILQVSNLSAYALTASRDMAVWVNDLRTGAAVDGASVSIAGGRALGTTDARGLLEAPTPADLLAPSAGTDDDFERTPAVRLLDVRAPDGRRLLVPLGLPVAWQYQEATGWYYRGDNQDWWVTFSSDRGTYRQTDVIRVSGMVRARSDRSVPATVEVRLRPEASAPEAAIVSTQARPTERGVFTAELRLDGLPRATYALDLYVGADRVSSLWVTVTEIRKPAYQIDVTTDRRVYLAGDDVRIGAQATFYDGSSVPGMELRIEGFGDSTVAQTGSTGAASVTFEARSEDGSDGIGYGSIGAAPAHPEEGQISGDRWVLVLPSAAWIDATGTVADGRIVVTGTLSRVDLAGLEAALRRDLELDPAGEPIGGGTINAVVVHEIPTRTKIGTTYDFIEKVVVPLYEYRTRSERIAQTTLTTAADGTFRLSMAAPVADDSYVITLTTQDGKGRRFVHHAHAHAPDPRLASPDRLPYLESLGFCGGSATIQARIDEAVDVTMHDADGTLVDDGRLLFLVGARGSMEASIQDAATFVRTLRDADLPGFTVRAVWLTPRGYFVADASVQVDPDEKAITITLRPDRARYRPGQTVRLAVTTTDRDGRPIAADVVLQGVDEKLYTLGFAGAANPLGELMSSVSPDFQSTYRTHAVPMDAVSGGCGDTGGGRDDFRDVVAFQRISTGADGRGTATFELSDDLTSWRITASAYSGRLDAGVGSVQIPVGLPFFVEAVLAPEYLVGDEAILLVRGYGDALDAGDEVRFTVDAPSLGLAPVTVEAAAFQTARVPLPRLTPGDHRVRIVATTGGGGEARRDELVRTVHVVATRLSALSSTFEPLNAGWTARGGEGLTRFTISDVGRGRLLGLLDELASADSARFDRTLAADLARAILVEEYGVPASALRASGYDADRFQESGIALLPYGSPDLALSARAALVAPERVNASALAEALADWGGTVGGGELSREREIIALAGLAGLGHDVGDRLRAFDPDELTVLERLWLGLGLAATGDEPAALAVERALLQDAGQRLGPWVRLLGPDEARSVEASALLLLLAARLGDPVSDDVARYIAATPSGEHVVGLEQVGYVRAVLERLPRSPARFAWTLDGERHEEALRAGGSFTLVLTRSQWAGLRLESIEGELGVATTFDSVDVALPSSPNLEIERSVTPAGRSSAGQLVHVRITVTFAAQLPTGCYLLTDLVPSGLAPVARTVGWYDEPSGREANSPWSIEGQRVTWCASPQDHVKVYEYAARVVTPGTYRWEPAVLQWEDGPSLGTSIPATSYVIE